MERKVQLTSDGSSTIYIPEMDETYHSSHGAIQEAVHVFIKHGIETLDQNEITVFEMGFGTGLNALLTSKYATSKNKKVNYIGIEAYPVEEELLKEINYIGETGDEYRPQFEEMHAIDWGVQERITENFELKKVHEKIESYQPKANEVDIVFYDAFGPKAQAAMWDISVLKKMCQMLKPNGMFVTYCAMGQFKRDLKTLGFSVESRPGPPGKREMTVAFKL